MRQEREQEERLLAEIEEGLRDPDIAWQAVRVALDAGLSDRVPRLLHRLWRQGAVTDSDLATVLPEVWIHNRRPLPCLGERTWVSMFKAAGFMCRLEQTRLFGEPDYQVGAFDVSLHDRAPEGPLTVYRGASLASRGRGLSWTMHADCARSFAEDVGALYQVPVGIYRAALPGRAVLAIFGDVREQEVVINPNMLRGRIVLSEEMPASFDLSQAAMSWVQRMRSR